MRRYDDHVPKNYYEHLLLELELHKDNERAMKIIFRFVQGITGDGVRNDGK